MEIKDIFDDYASKIAQLHLYQRAMQKIAKKELQELDEYEKSIEKKPDLKELSCSYQKMHFRNAKDGSPVFFSYIKSTIEDMKLSVILHKNKQYQWLLSEAYEAYEDFIETSYAFAGYSDNNIWPLKDYGNISLTELREKPFTWYVEQSKKKRDTPNSIINIFKTNFPEISEIENNNALDINLRLAVILIEHLRHIIVHNGGVVTDKTDFIKRVLEKSGLYNNGKYDETHESFIKNLFGNDEHENTVVLLEIRIHPEVPIDVYVNVFDVLSGYLMTYAHIIFENLLVSTHNKSLNTDAQ